MKRAILFLMLWASSVAIVGCSTVDTAIRDVEIKDYNDPIIDFSFKSHANHLKLIDTDATRRATYVRARGEPKFVIVAEPPPDAAVSYMNALQAKATGLKGGASTDLIVYLAPASWGSPEAEKFRRFVKHSIALMKCTLMVP